MSLWFASAPPLPPAPQVGGVVADWRPSKAQSVVRLCLAVDLGAAGAVLLALGYSAFAVIALSLGFLVALSWAGVRRTYLAVGDDWLYVRALPGGGWTLLSGLTSGKMAGPHRMTLLLRGPAFRGRLPASDASMRRPTTFHGELARRVLARHLELEPQARFVLRAWAGLVAPETSES